MSRIPESRMEAKLGRKRLRHPMDHSDNNDCLVAMATRRQKEEAKIALDCSPEFLEGHSQFLVG